MGIPNSQEGSQEDGAKMHKFMSEYEPETGYIPEIPDASMYRPKSQSSNSDPHSRIVLIKRYAFRSKEETPRFLELMRIRKSMPESYLPRMLDSFMKIDNGYCQTFYTYHVAFDFVQHNLEKEIRSRAKSPQESKYFGENEVWYMLYSVVKGLEELRAVGISHGDVQPCFVMIDESGNVRLVDFMCYQGVKNTGLMRMLSTNTHQSPLAPENIDTMIKRIPNNNYSLEKADIYALGITLLSICTVCDYKTEFYDFRDYRILENKITDQLAFISKQGLYSPALIQALFGMLHTDPIKRISLAQLLKYVCERVDV